MVRRRWQVGCAVALLVVGLAVACGDSGRDPDAPPLSLLWISLDTLRADHLSLYGYPRNTSPFLDEIARRGLYVEWAISPQPSTLPVHLTQFTGYHPVVHGVMHSRKNPGIRLQDGVRTLPEVLRDAGFATRGWVDGGKMGRDFGFGRGFDEYYDVLSGLDGKLAAALEALDELPPDRRFFFLVHTFEIHSPYQPLPPYDRRYVTPGRRTEAIVDRDYYDGSIRFVDDQLRDFFGELERRGRLASTVVVITGDHGENFQEYGIPVTGHSGLNLHQNTTRVPWIVLSPDERYRGRVVRTAGLIDFANTMLSLLDIDERMPGGGRVAFEAAESDSRTPPSYVSWSGPGAWSLYRGDLHFLESEEPGPERNALYDVARDPRERRRLENPELAAEMAAELEARRRELLAEARRIQRELRVEGVLSQKVIDELRALGYAVDPDSPGP